jgi:hypothetical protein
MSRTMCLGSVPGLVPLKGVTGGRPRLLRAWAEIGSDQSRHDRGTATASQVAWCKVIRLWLPSVQFGNDDIFY